MPRREPFVCRDCNRVWWYARFLEARTSIGWATLRQFRLCPIHADRRLAAGLERSEVEDPAVPPTHTGTHVVAGLPRPRPANHDVYGTQGRGA